MLRFMRPALARIPAPSAAIARARLQCILSANRNPITTQERPTDLLLKQLLGEAPADEGRAA